MSPCGNRWSCCFVTKVGKPETFSSAQTNFCNVRRFLFPIAWSSTFRCPGSAGWNYRAELSKERADMPIIFITGHGDIPMTVRAMKAGAVEFLTKPFTNEMLVSAIQQALDRSRAALAEQEEMLRAAQQTTPLSRRANVRSWCWWLQAC